MMLIQRTQLPIQVQFIRHVSSKYIKPHPRTYKRRLFEAAVAPVMPPSLDTCATVRLQYKQNEHLRGAYAPYELALVKKVQNWIEEEQFRVLAVCQLQPVDQRTLHFAKNQLRLKGLEVRDYGPRIMQKVFEGTPFEALNPLFCSFGMGVLYGYEPSAIKVIVEDATKYNYIVPLCVTLDWRIITMDQAKQIAKYASLDDARAQTVGLLSALSSQMAGLLDALPTQLVRTLASIEKQ